MATLSTLATLTVAANGTFSGTVTLSPGAHTLTLSQTIAGTSSLGLSVPVAIVPPAPAITVPTLFLAGSADPVLGFTPRDRVRDVVAGDYREVMIDGAGHWLQQERPDEVNAVLIEFIDGLGLK